MAIFGNRVAITVYHRQREDVMSAIQGERIVLEQEQGNSVNLIVTGDEFYARLESPQGYTVVYDNKLGLYCYATLVNGRFKSTEIPLHKRPSVGTKKHLQESPSVLPRCTLWTC